MEGYQMKTITFTCPNPRHDGYGCSEPGDHSGKYVRAEVARELLEACKSAVAIIPVLEVRNYPPGWVMKREAVQRLLTAICKAEGAE